MVKSKSVADFDKKVHQHSSALGVVWNVLRWVMHVSEWKGTETVEQLVQTLSTVLRQEVQLSIK